jgi:hypothetical protein
MKRSVLIGIVSLALALTASAQMPYNQLHKKAPQTTTTNPAYRTAAAVRQAAPQRTFSNARFREPSFSTARFRDPVPRTARVQPRMNSSFVNGPAITRSTTSRRFQSPVTNDWRGSRFSPRPRPNDSFVNRSLVRDDSVRRETHSVNNTRWADAGFRERRSARSSFVNRSMGSDALGRKPPRQSFNDYWANANVRERLGTNSSFVNGSRNTAFWSGPRGGRTNNWRSSQFSGSQYRPFRNYQSQWHNSDWWNDHCDTIVFVTVYSQPFPFYFAAGYWYPAWGYYSDAYYPYDGPIYGYNDLPPDEVITNVQIQLYNEGYYDGPIDGILGPDTQAAIADYQADHGLAVTAAIDEPTVESLGLV